MIKERGCYISIYMKLGVDVMSNIKNEEKGFLFSRSQKIVESDLISAGFGDNYEEIMKSLYEQHSKAMEKHNAKLVKNKIHHN